MFRKAIGVISAIGGVYCIIGAFVTKQSPLNLLLCVIMGVLLLVVAYLLFKSAKKAEEKAQESGNVIVKTKIVDAYGKTSTASAATRGVVGNAVAGPVGAIVGATTAKSNRSTTFVIFYKNGKKKTRTVPNNSFEYQKYIKYLE